MFDSSCNPVSVIMSDKKKLTYENENGDTVFTSQFLNNRGTCCKTNCLHCPFGTTIKNLGLQFEEVHVSDLSKAQAIITSNDQSASELSGMLLTSAFGTKKKIKVSEKNISKFKFIYIKEVLCGLAYKGITEVKEIYLLDEFKDQGIDKSLVSGFLEP